MVFIIADIPIVLVLGVKVKGLVVGGGGIEVSYVLGETVLIG